jgi:hypothetical protein
MPATVRTMNWMQLARASMNARRLQFIWLDRYAQNDLQLSFCSSWS